MRKLASSTLLLVCSSLPAVARAEEPQVTVDVSVGGSVATNPFLYTDGETAGTVTLGAHPTVVWADEVGKTAIEGDLRLSQYTNRYGSDLSGGVDVTSERMLDEKTTLRLAAAFHSLRSAVQDNFLLVGEDPLNPGLDPVPEIPPVDTTTAGTRGRTQTANASIGVTRVIDEVSSIDAGIGLNASFFDTAGTFDYRTLSGQVGYNRKISQQLTVTATLQGSLVDYRGGSIGDSKIISPQIGIQQQLTPRLSFVASAGISYVMTNIGTGTDTKRTTFAGSVGLCNRGLDQTFCVTASRSAQPTALGGVSSVTSIAANYDVVLSQKDRLSLAARYGRTSENGNIGISPLTRISDIVGASATYGRQINDRLTFTVTPAYTKIYDDVQGRREGNASLMVGLTMRFGKLR